MRWAARLCLRAAFALWYSVIFFILTVLAGVICLIVSLFSRRAARVITGKVWAAVVFAPAFIRLKAQGRENIPGDGGFVIVSNHRSLLDIPAVAMSTGLPVTWLAKASLGRIPLFGWCLKRGHMLIEREGGAEAVKQMVAEASRRLEAREVISIFPEGTRNRDKDPPLLPFKKGAFLLAKHNGATILPMATHNTGRLWPAGALLPRSGTFEVAIGKPIPTAPGDTLAAVTKRSQDAVLALYQAMEAGLEARGAGSGAGTGGGDGSGPHGGGGPQGGPGAVD
jgi:1-acyl-sn-glycerol-3-phosphate acyltransferase